MVKHHHPIVFAQMTCIKEYVLGYLYLLKLLEITYGTVVVITGCGEPMDQNYRFRTRTLGQSCCLLSISN